MTYTARKILRLFFVLLTAVLATSLMVRAESVPAIGQIDLGGTSLAERPELSGDVLEDRSLSFLLFDARFDQNFDLTLRNMVVREEATGTLDFYYRVRNDSDSEIRLVDMDTGRFTREGSLDPIDVDFRSDKTGKLSPVMADRQASRFGGVLIDFPFFETLAPGDSTDYVFVKTQATDYELAGVTQFRSTPGSTSGNGFVPTFSPILEGPLVPVPPAAIPLPPAIYCGGIMLLTIAARRWKASR